MTLKQLRQEHALKRDELALLMRTESGEAEYQFHRAAVDCIDRVLIRIEELIKDLTKDIKEDKEKLRKQNEVQEVRHGLRA